MEKADVVVCECTFAPVYKGMAPSFQEVSRFLGERGLYPIIFQGYGYQVSTYAVERDVLFVKPHLLPNVFYENQAHLKDQ